jgi:Leucine-rich repeat (LRR) protein
MSYLWGIDTLINSRFVIGDTNNNVHWIPMNPMNLDFDNDNDLYDPDSIEFYCENQNLSSLKDATIPQDTIDLFCKENKLRDFEGLPLSVKYIHCSRNKISSFKGLHSNVETIIMDNNKITNLNELSKYAPNLIDINCDFNNITGLHCFIGIPKSLQTLKFNRNPIHYSVYKMTIDEIHYLNRWFEGLIKLRTLRLHYQIYKWWMSYWHHRLDHAGFSRFIKFRAVRDYNEYYLS